MAQRVLSIEYSPLVSLRLDPQNPRLHSKKQLRQIARSIETFGFNVPVLIDARGQVIAGHGRVLAAKLLGITHVPTISLEHLTEAQIRTFMITDNRLTEASIWDDRLLAEQLKALSVLKLDFSIDVTGFEMREIDMRIEGLAAASHDKDNPADAIPALGARSQVTQAGDLWLMGDHRLYCGDALNNSAYCLLMQGRLANMIFTDPPYNDPTVGYAPGPWKAQDQTSQAEFMGFLKKALAPLTDNSIDSALHFICMDWRRSGELIDAARSLYAEFMDLCVWVKDDADPGLLYRGQHELIFVFRNGGTSQSDKIQFRQHEARRSNVWRYRRVKNASQMGRKGKQSALYAAIKPVELVADAILDSTAQGDVVLDPFLGSGTTVIAAERTGRVCYGIEVDPCYVDAIVRRWQAFTGQSAVQESTGRTFDAMEGMNGRS